MRENALSIAGNYDLKVLRFKKKQDKWRNSKHPEKFVAFAVGGGGLGGGGVRPSVTEKTFEDYHLYTLTRPTTLRDRETKQVEFLHQSLHPENRHDHDIEATRRWASGAQWLGLQVMAAPTEENDENEARVEFIATYKEGGIVKPHHEISRFSKLDDDWFYVDGELVTPQTATREHPKVGRNEPCPCGSGKKYKKCCGA